MKFFHSFPKRRPTRCRCHQKLCLFFAVCTTYRFLCFGSRTSCCLLTLALNFSVVGVLQSAVDTLMEEGPTSSEPLFRFSLVEVCGSVGGLLLILAFIGSRWTIPFCFLVGKILGGCGKWFLSSMNSEIVLSKNERRYKETCEFLEGDLGFPRLLTGERTYGIEYVQNMFPSGGWSFCCAYILASLIAARQETKLKGWQINLNLCCLSRRTVCYLFRYRFGKSIDGGHKDELWLIANWNLVQLFWILFWNIWIGKQAWLKLEARIINSIGLELPEHKSKIQWFEY